MSGRIVGEVLRYAPADLRTRRHERAAWRRGKALPYARTPGGSVIHRPDCVYIRSTIAVAEAVIRWIEGRGPEPNGNITHPYRLAAHDVRGRRACRICHPNLTGTE